MFLIVPDPNSIEIVRCQQESHSVGCSHPFSRAAEAARGRPAVTGRPARDCPKAGAIGHLAGAAHEVPAHRAGNFRFALPALRSGAGGRQAPRRCPRPQRPAAGLAARADRAAAERPEPGLKHRGGACRISACPFALICEPVRWTRRRPDSRTSRREPRTGPASSAGLPSPTPDGAHPSPMRDPAFVIIAMASSGKAADHVMGQIA